MGALPFCQLSYRGRIRKAGLPVEVKTVGDAIRKRRIELGIRQAGAAQQIGCDTTSVGNWEKNHTAPCINHMAAIVRFLGYDPTPKCDKMAQRLVNQRTVLGMTQKALAKKIGVNPSTLARWERGEREPTGRFLAVVTEALR